MELESSKQQIECGSKYAYRRITNDFVGIESDGNAFTGSKVDFIFITPTDDREYNIASMIIATIRPFHEHINLL